MKLFFLFTIAFSTLLSAYNIDQILDLYRKDSDLSNKTKNEALGHLTVYTRDDIERMQAYTLGDLLNSVRTFRYNENMFGMPDVFHTDLSMYASDTVKIFINNHEITSAFTGSGLFIYGNVDLGFVDHVEIYEGSTSTYVNADPSIVTIKLYSKDPSREDGSRVQTYMESRGTHHENVSYASHSEELKYFLYASNTDKDRIDYTYNNHELSRDYKNNHALATFDYKNIQIGAEYINHRMDPFLSLSMFATPRDGDIDYQLYRLSSTMSFLDDDSLKLSFSFIRINEHLNLNMDGTRWTTDTTKFFIPQDSLLSDSIDDVYNIKFEKSVMYKNNNFIFGSEYVKKSMHDTETYNNGIIDATPTFVDNTIMSLYMQDDYSLSKNQLFTASIKQNYYYNKSDKEEKDFNTFQVRIGYIVTSKSTTFKAFASQMKIPTEQYVLSSTTGSEIELLRIRDVSSEYIYRLKKHTFGLCLEYIENENSKILINQYNVNQYSANYSGSLQYDYNFDEFNNFESMVYTNKYHDQVSTKEERVQGGFIRLLNTWNKFDIYNEANYYELLDSSIKGINYSAGVRYKVTKALIFSLKGTNIFDSAAKSRYSYLKIDEFTSTVESFEISPIDRSFTIGLDYSF